MRQVTKLVKRAPEEELMDLPAHAQAYANADFSEPNSKFVALFSEKFPGFNRQRILDLGCGLADITMRLAEQTHKQKSSAWTAPMPCSIAGKEILQHSSLANRVDIRKWHIGRQENPLGSEGFHAVVSNSLLHHMHDPLDLLRAIRACAAPGAAVLVMDLIRPQSRIEAENIVEKYAGKEPEVLRNDFLNSLLAAYRPAEIMEQLVSANMEFLQIEIVSDRHFIVFGSIG
jgi:2-polyprenyl-3-methyl-5-hydroxy-6-metoxy-1,4-benzoquinol methylase